MIVVTGGTGLVGSHLLMQLAKNNVPVLALKRKASDMRLFNKVFSGCSDAIKNIERSLNHKRTTQIIFVYQDPLQAWPDIRRLDLSQRQIRKYNHWCCDCKSQRELTNHFRASELGKNDQHAPLADGIGYIPGNRP